MTDFSLEFRAIREERPGERWKEQFQASWPSYRDWFLSEGDAARPDLETCRRMLRRFMPELVPLWEELVALAGNSRQAARMLSLYRPAPYLSGCSQAVWLKGHPMLVRNYDYHPRFCEGTLLLSRWNGVQVLGMTDCLWGILDGINEHGLCVALSFGGRRVVGDGFGIPLVLRYVLELCCSAKEAISVLLRVPSHMAYNVTIMDASGVHGVVALSPDREPVVRTVAVATNHQLDVEWSEYERLTRSAEREVHLQALLQDKTMDAEEFTLSFLESPLYNRNFGRAFGTLYTARYQPKGRKAELIWPGARWSLSIHDFREQIRLVEYSSSGRREKKR